MNLKTVEYRRSAGFTQLEAKDPAVYSPRKHFGLAGRRDGYLYILANMRFIPRKLLTGFIQHHKEKRNGAGFTHYIILKLSVFGKKSAGEFKPLAQNLGNI